MKNTLIIVTIILLTFIKNTLYGQCDERASSCLPKLKPFNSNGQYYRVQLVENEVGKIRLVFNSNLVYRIASCNQSNDGKALIIKIFDMNGKQVFSNESDTKNFWDIQFGATAQYTIQANYPSGSGCAALLVGYLPKEKYQEIK